MTGAGSCGYAFKRLNRGFQNEINRTEKWDRKLGQIDFAIFSRKKLYSVFDSYRMLLERLEERNLLVWLL